MNHNSALFSQSIGKAMMIFFSIIVLISFARNFLPFQILYVLPTSIAVSTAYLLIKRPSIPRASRSDIMPFIASLSIVTILTVYFSKVPYFPDFPSIDMKSHAAIIGSIASGGGMGGIQGQLLYYAIRYILSTFASVLPIPTLFTVRYGMGIIVALSPFIFYDSMLSLFKSHRTAWIIALFYALSGLWMSMVFYSGLLPNFYAWLAALFLISATCQFIEKKVGILTIILWSLAFINALFSHYSIVFYMVPLAFFALLQSRKERLPLNGRIGFAAIIGTLSIGIFATGAVNSFFSFLGGVSFPFADTTLSAFIPLSIFRFFFALLGNDFLSILMMILLSVFAYATIKKRSLPSLLVLSTFILIVVISPFNFGAWRFAFIAFLALIVMCGQTLSLPMLKTKKIDFNVPTVALVAFLMFFPTFAPSWGFSVITSDSNAVQQSADYRAMSWIVKHINNTDHAVSLALVAQDKRLGFISQNAVKFVTNYSLLLSLNDRAFIYQQVLYPKSPNVLYAPDYHIILQVPAQASYLAINLSANYLIVSRNGTAPVFPTPKPFDLFLSANATQITPNQSISFTLHSPTKFNAPFVLVINNLPEIMRVVNGTGTITINFIDKGEYTIFAQSVPNGALTTFPFTVSVGSKDSPSPRTVGIPDDFYSPWWVFSSYTLGGANLVYSSDYVHIFKITH